MIINELRYVSGIPPVVDEYCTVDCGSDELGDACSNIYESLTVYCSSGPEQGHVCNNACFDAYILDFGESQRKNKDVLIYLQRADFNNSPAGDTIKITIPITKEVVQKANAAKKTVENCCVLDLILLPSPSRFEQERTLPYEDSKYIYMPPVGSESYVVPNSIGSNDHENIVLTRVVRDSDGQVLAPSFIWQGAAPIDICVGL